MSNLQTIIEDAFESRADITPRNVEAQVKDAVMEAIDLLDTGQARVSEKKGNEWVVNEWLKKAGRASLPTTTLAVSVKVAFVWFHLRRYARVPISPPAWS